MHCVDKDLDRVVLFFSNPLVVVSSVKLVQGHSHTKAAASQIALLIQSQRTLFIHYLFSGCAIVAEHYKER